MCIAKYNRYYVSNKKYILTLGIKRSRDNDAPFNSILEFALLKKY